MARKQPTKSEKLASALLALDEARCKLDPTLKACIDRERAKTLSAQEIERQMGLEWAHVVHVAWDGDNHPTNLVPMRKADHRRETAKKDQPAIAKVKRISAAWKEYQDNACRNIIKGLREPSPEIDAAVVIASAKTRAIVEKAAREKKKKWPSRPMQGGRKSPLKKHMSGKVSSRSGPRTSE